jgi:hypothetical protein
LRGSRMSFDKKFPNDKKRRYSSQERLKEEE